VNGYLLDSNFPSEFSWERPEPRVVDWLKAQPGPTLFLSAVTIGEIRKGLTVLPPGRRRSDLEKWFHSDLLTWFRERILPVTYAIADRWGELDGQCQLRGTPLNTADGMIAATARLNMASHWSRA
jgi:toxin FitB